MSVMLLFARKPLRDELLGRETALKRAVDQLDVGTLMGPISRVVSALVEEYGLEPLVLHEDQMTQQHTEVKIQQHRNPMFGHGPNLPPADGLRVQAFIPFEGNSDLFQLQPSTHILFNAPTALIQGDELVLTFEGISPHPDQIKQHFERELGMVRTLVENVNNDLRGWMMQLGNVAQQAVMQRRSRLEHSRNVQDALAIPMRRRDDAPQPAPVERKPLGLKALKQKAESEPAYRLEDEAYEQVIEVLLNMGKALERSPRTFAKLQETELRDFMLVILNSSFEGAAGGEWFNGDGKTDILVRFHDRNVFIGECKFWHGETRFPETIEQLLGYTVWRDTKAAIILFVIAKDVTSIIDKAEQVIRSHSCFVDPGPASGDPSQRRNFVMHHKDDDERLIHLALLPFAIRSD